jgi:hypothetical protein
MRRLLLVPFKSLSLASVGVGIVSAAVLAKFGRPLLVETLRLGFEAKDSTARVWEDAKEQASALKSEAQAEARKPRPKTLA